MAGLIGAQSSGNRYADIGDGAFHLVPNPDTAAAHGFDWNDVFWYGSDDSLPGSIGAPFDDVDAAPSPTSSGPPPPSSGPPSPPPTRSIVWGKNPDGSNRVWTPDELPAFIAYLHAHGTDYSSWAQNHAAAALIMEGPPVDPQREPVPKSVGEALVSYIAAGQTAAQAAASVAALVAALNAQGVTDLTPEQVLADAQTVTDTLTAEQTPPAIEPPPTYTPPPPPGSRELQSVDSSQREAVDLSNLPPIALGFKPIDVGQVTEALIVNAALVEHADLWIMLGTCKVESGFNLEYNKNSAGAVGPMQVLGYPQYDGSPNQVEWAWGNLIVGARLLAKYAAIYNGDQAKMSAAYNAGTGAVNQHWPDVLTWLEVKGHPEDGDVQDYVDKVATVADDYRRRFGGGWNIDPQTGQLVGGKPPPTYTPPPTTPESIDGGISDAWSALMTAIGADVPSELDDLQGIADSFVTIFQ